jgi:hypothetical protein
MVISDFAYLGAWKYVVKQKVLGLMLLCKYGLAHKPIAAGFCYFLLRLKRISEKNVLVQSVHL